MNKNLEQLNNDGGSLPVTADDISSICSELDDLRTVGTTILSERLTNERTRLCYWNGQSADGRKYEDNMGADKVPFDGASDNRIRLADQIATELMIEQVLAATKMVPRAKGVDGTDAATAGKLTTFIKYMLRNMWGTKWRRELAKLSNWGNSDKPALAVMHTYWDYQRSIGLEYIDVEQLADILMQSVVDGEQDDMMRMEVIDVLTNVERRPEFMELLSALLPHLSDKRLNELIDELYEVGSGTFPLPYDSKNEPCIECLRVGEDIFFPDNTRDIQHARIVVLRRWLTKAQVLSRAATDGWSKDFVTKLIGGEYDKGQEGKSSLIDEGMVMQNLVHDQVLYDPDQYKGLYEVLMVYRKAVNEDGYCVRQVVPFSGVLKQAAKSWEILDYKHGKLPFTPYSREFWLTSSMMDSRGVPDLVTTDQNSVKILCDTMEDHVQVNTFPPLKRPPGRPRFDLSLAPFGQIDAGPRDNVEYLTPPQYPQSAEKYYQRRMQMLNDYWGRMDGVTDPQRSVAKSQWRVDTFLDAVREIIVQAVQLCQQYMDDAQLQRIVGTNGIQLGRSMQEIQGQFDVDISFDVRNLDMEFVMQKVRIVLQELRPADTRQIVDYEQIITVALQSIDSNWADIAVLPRDTATQREVDEARRAYQMMVNGMQPDTPEDGINAELRKQTIVQELEFRNQAPDAFPVLSPASMQMINAYLDYLDFQIQQRTNAETGRSGYVQPNPVELVQQAGGAA